MNNGNSLILVVTPVFEDSVACGHLFSDLVNQYGEKLYIVAVDDGSIDQPLSIESLKSAGANGVLLNLRRNFGHQVAMRLALIM